MKFTNTLRTKKQMLFLIVGSLTSKLLGLLADTLPHQNIKKYCSRVTQDQLSQFVIGKAKKS